MSKIAISNPLTLIAIFAGLAESAAIGALPFLEPGIQSTFVWFVMLFPALLVALFFAVLWWRPENLYAPGDYREDASYLNVQGNKQPPRRPSLAPDQVEGDAGVGGAAAELPLPNAIGLPEQKSPIPALEAADVAIPAVTAEVATSQAMYQMQTPAPTPKIAQATLAFGEEVMAERLALQKLQSIWGGELTSEATVSANGVPYRFDGVLVLGRAVNILEVLYKRNRDIGSSVKKKLELFLRLKKQMLADGDKQDVIFTIAVVTREPEDALSIDSMVRNYAKSFDLEVRVEVFDLRSLMNEFGS